MSATPEAALGQVLDSTTEITDIRSTNLYAGPVPEGTAYPYQVITRIDRPYVGHMKGIAPQATARVQLDTFSDDAEEAERLAALSYQALLAFGGGNVTLGDESIDVVSFRIIDDDAEDDLIDDGNGVTSIRRVRQDYSVSHVIDN